MYDVENVPYRAVNGTGGLLVLVVLAASAAVLFREIVEVVQLSLFDLGGRLRWLMEDERWKRVL